VQLSAQFQQAWKRAPDISKRLTFFLYPYEPPPAPRNPSPTFLKSAIGQIP